MVEGDGETLADIFGRLKGFFGVVANLFEELEHN
jgi:hypothetical protein